MKLHGCNTLQPDYVEPQDTFLVQDGYIDIENELGLIVDRKPRYIYIRNRMSRDCKYDRIAIDAQCKGCERGKQARGNNE